VFNSCHFYSLAFWFAIHCRPAANAAAMQLPLGSQSFFGACLSVPVSVVGQTFQKHFKNLTQVLQQKNNASNKIACFF